MAGHRQSGSNDASGIFDGAFRIVVVLTLGLVVLTGVRLATDRGPSPGPGAAVASPTPGASLPGPPASGGVVDVAAYLDPEARPAPPLDLAGPAGNVRLDALRGQPVLVFFGYTHCPDVCPATIGTVGLAIDAYAGDAQAILVSVDPERDTPEWLAEFVRYLPEGFDAVSGTPGAVRRTADAWGVRYARVETDDPNVYTVSHTADVFVVDRAGMLRARLPFGTDAPTMTAVLEAIDAVPAATPAATQPVAATASPSPPPIADLEPILVSSSVWAGGPGPIIFTLGVDPASGSAITIPDDRTVTAQLLAPDGSAAGEPEIAVAVRPQGIDVVSYVATIEVPSAGPWQLHVTAEGPGGEISAAGSLALDAREQGGTAPLGQPAPAARTDTVTDVPDLLWLTTDPVPDRRLYATSTEVARVSGRPFVFVVDSYNFKVTPQCGQAVVMAKRLLDRWTESTFIHHEPYRYSVVTEQALLEGSITEPRLTEVALAWGVGDSAWGVQSMPWIFIVDGDGILRAKYQGIMGSADVDVMLTLLEAEAE